MRMLEVEILGVKLSADLLNPDVAERYECGYLDALDDMTHLYENYVTPQIKDKMQTLTGDAKKG